jgi:hypothetical protein
VTRLQASPSSRFATALAVKSGSLILVSINGVQVQVQCARDLVPGVGDVLTLARFGGLWVATGRVFAAATTVDPWEGTTGPDPTPDTVTGSLVVAAVETRSYRSIGWRTDTTQTIQGEYAGNGNHTGCAFYGSAPRSLAGATVQSASVAVRRGGGGAFAASGTTLWLVTQATRPGGAPTRTSSTSGPALRIDATDLAFTVPTAWAQSMVDGTAGGLAIYNAAATPYVRLEGLREWGPAWTLTINWRR